jgi:hypothetical protein
MCDLDSYERYILQKEKETISFYSVFKYSIIKIIYQFL